MQHAQSAKEKETKERQIKDWVAEEGPCLTDAKRNECNEMIRDMCIDLKPIIRQELEETQEVSARIDWEVVNVFDVNQDKYVEQASRGRPEGSFRSIEDRNQIRLQTIKRERERGCIESDDAILRRYSYHFYKNLMWQSQATEDDATFDVRCPPGKL